MAATSPLAFCSQSKTPGPLPLCTAYSLCPCSSSLPSAARIPVYQCLSLTPDATSQALISGEWSLPSARCAPSAVARVRCCLGCLWQHARSQSLASNEPPDTASLLDRCEPVCLAEVISSRFQLALRDGADVWCVLGWLQCLLICYKALYRFF